MTDLNPLPPPVWNPGSQYSTCCHHETEVNEGMASECSCVRRPSSSDRTQRLINNALNPHGKHSTNNSNNYNNNNDYDFSKFNEYRSKSCEYTDIEIYGKNLNTEYCEIKQSGGIICAKIPPAGTNMRDTNADPNVCSVQNIMYNKKCVDCDKKDTVHNKETNGNISSKELVDMIKFLESGEDQHAINRQQQNRVRHFQKKHAADFASIATNRPTSKFLVAQTHGPNNLNCNSDAKSSAIYAVINKSNGVKKCTDAHMENKIIDIAKEFPKIPSKSKYMSEEFENTELINGLEQNPLPLPQIQVMFNPLSPMLLHRIGSNRWKGSSSETSPESTPVRKGSSSETSPESTPVRKGSSSETSPESTPERTGSSSQTSPESTPESLPKELSDNRSEHVASKAMTGQDENQFMDLELSKTWHGTTSSDGAQYYGPQMHALMKKLNKLNADNAESSHSDLDKNSVEIQCQTSKSLLDEMHKKLCADQYLNSKETEIARALVMFRLKSHPQSKPKRSQSLNIKMGTGVSHVKFSASSSNSSGSLESSPCIPRKARLCIKTQPGVHYSPRSGRTGETTSETLNIEEIPYMTQCAGKEDAEIEALEACQWLRETGFPQYAQLYEDGQFPVDAESVEKDHDFLEKEDIHSLFRRLNTLNKCAIMKVGTPVKKESQESDDEDQCALSYKWKYQHSIGRWSRKDFVAPILDTTTSQPFLTSALSHDSLLTDQNSDTCDSPVLASKTHHHKDDKMIKNSTLYANDIAMLGVSPKLLRRVASEKIKGAKSFLKRVESLKNKRGKKHKAITEIGEPVISDKADMQEKMKHLNCRDINSSDKETVKASDTIISHVSSDKLADSVSALVLSPISPHRTATLTVINHPERNGAAIKPVKILNSSSLDKSMNNGTSDLLVNSTNGSLGRDSTISQQNNTSELINSSEETLFVPVDYRPGKFPKSLDDSLFSSDSNLRSRSFSDTDEEDAKDTMKTRCGSHDPRNQSHRSSIYDNVPIDDDLMTTKHKLDIIISEIFQNINGLNRAINGEDAEILRPPVVERTDSSSEGVNCPTPDIKPSLDTYSDIVLDETEVMSGTLSSLDSSDHEIQNEDITHNDSAEHIAIGEHIAIRERRDSGVGSSLTRTKGEGKKYRIRWHSFQKSHRPTSESCNLQLYSLSAEQIMVLRKLSLLKLSALIEKHVHNRSGWSLTVPRFMKRHKVPDYKDKNVFGVPFFVTIQRTGQALPQCILHAMRFLRRTSADALGIFRKSGVRSRIQKLRNDIETDPESVDFAELQAYDVADLVKQYFRELPECLLTNKLSDIFISIFSCMPAELRLEALQYAVILMSDENRDVLQTLLLFLSDIAQQANKHQMNSSNLAVCFAPSLFNMGGMKNSSQTPSPRRNRKSPGIPDAHELMEQKAAHECLTVMIQECNNIFMVPTKVLSKCQLSQEDPPVTLEELNQDTAEGSHGYTSYIDSCVQELLKESRDKFRGWEIVANVNDIEISYKRVGDGNPLRLWKCTVDVEAPPNEVLNRVLHDRQLWDEDLIQWHVVEKLDKQTDVFQHVRNSMAPHPTRDFCVLRSWKTDLPKGTCVLISISITHKDAENLGGIQATELVSRYLIEPCSTGKSRLTHISRVDMRGLSPEWYKKVYGHICANFLDRIRASFHNNADGPETKVHLYDPDQPPVRSRSATCTILISHLYDHDQPPV